VRHDKASALLGLARRLASTAEGMTLDEMAAAMGVGRRTAERMRDALAALFPELEEVAEGSVKRFRIKGGLDGVFQSPTREELVELSKTAAALSTSGAAPRARALESLERKVRSAMRSSALRKVVPDLEALVRAETIAVQAGPRPYEDEALIATVRQAVMAMKALSFTYLGGARPGTTRSVAPYGLMFGRANYLVATELGKDEPRNWRLDRIRDAQVLETTAFAPADFNLHDYADRSFGIFQDSMEELVLRVTPEGADEALNWRFHPSQKATPQADGSVIVTFRASGMLELAWHLFTWQSKIEILAPQRLKELMASELAAALAWHDPGVPAA
jgi:predicted DNA-binding transcriptional regulator YafY